ncbi:MAG: DUF896 domain-containing protein [Lachnospiraceae bacterium]|nr:DUF896 domain-containing protein [Lachnospiraceae bacterium]
MTEEKIARINELYHKSKDTGLTDEELAEQKALRQEYLADIKKSIRAQMENVDVVEKDGTVVNAAKRHDEKYGDK